MQVEIMVVQEEMAHEFVTGLAEKEDPILSKTVM